MQARHGIPVSEQLLTTLGGRPLQAATLAASGVGHGSTVQLLLRLCGGKGGFGALLRGQGRDGKITDNFDACRDLSGRRVRQVEAEKKLKQWEQDAKERELEKLALKHMKDMARQAKKDREFQVGWTRWRRWWWLSCVHYTACRQQSAALALSDRRHRVCVRVDRVG